MEIMIDSRQRVWVAPYNNGIRCFSKDGTLLASYTTQNSQLNNDVVLCMTERDDHIWIGTDGGGINILDPGSNEMSILEIKELVDAMKEAYGVDPSAVAVAGPAGAYSR